VNLSFYIARRLAVKGQKRFSAFIIRLSITATAISVAAMILTLGFVNGFQQAVSEKIFSFWGHIRVQHYQADRIFTAEAAPITSNDTVMQIIRNQAGVKNIQSFATRSAVLEHKQEIEGVLFKGIGKDYDSAQLKPFLKAGRWLQYNDSSYSKEILVSAQTAAMMNLKIADTIKVYFISEETGTSTYRKLVVAGLYRTGVEEFDKLFAIGDIRLIQLLNNWTNQQIGGYEIFLNDYHQMDTTNSLLMDQLPIEWSSKTTKEFYPNIFDWLGVQDINRNVIFIIMAIIAIINLITCLLILVLERTKMIGTLKSIGASDWMIQKVFLYHATLITLKGIGIGLIGGLGICLLQQQTGFIKLDEVNYYVVTAPVLIHYGEVILVCLATAVVCYLALIIPTLLIRKMQPVKALQFR
jgi:lipoprotein-releasing system permease protein